jgi:NAD+ synthase
MPDKFSLALAQLNPAVGDIGGNVDKLRTARRKAAEQGADVIMTSELFISAYPPEDLVLKPSFQNAIRNAVEALMRETADGGPAILLGTPWREDDRLFNAMLLLDKGKIAGRTFKRDLPNYGPFDEKRVFTSWPMQDVIDFRGKKLGVMICEDMWTPTAARVLKERGAQMLLVPNASPFETTKFTVRHELAKARISETGLPLVYVHLLGGQDELVFDGASFVLDATGKCAVQAPAWKEDVITTRWSVDQGKFTPEIGIVKAIPNGEEAIYHALLLGLRDYVRKNGFPGVVLGLSGGIDSALVAALAVDALGADKVWTVMLPSPYTSQESVEDADALAKKLGCRHDSIHISMAMDAFDATLATVFDNRAPDVTEENIQSRCRGLILMALSNKFGPMVLSTGNKSEMSVGYSTLYGDLCGGFAPLKDVYKAQVYKVSRWRNAHKPDFALGPSGTVIPERIFTKAPTAELRTNQTDQDSLPPYDELDDILECLVEKDMGLQDIVSRGHDMATVKRIWAMLDRAEYKRRQAPPGVKITSRHLGKDRRYPITNKYREA